MPRALPYRPSRIYVIPCSGPKLDHPAPARELYTGSYFKVCWAAAHELAREAGLVVILSARHGLVLLDDELDPYDTRMSDPDAITADQLTEQARTLGIDQIDDVTVFAPAAYAAAALKVWPHAKTPLTGLAIGQQQQLLNNLRGEAEWESIQLKAAAGQNPASATPPAPSALPEAPSKKVHAAQPVENLAENNELYDLPYDYKQTGRDFTVTIAGPERHDGEKPYTFVVHDYSTNLAWAKALAWFMVEQETPDAYVVSAGSFEGIPDKDCGYFWTDLRPEFARQSALDDLADQATEAVTQFHRDTEGMVQDGDVDPKRQTEYDTALDDAACAAWPLILAMASHDGR